MHSANIAEIFGEFCADFLARFLPRLFERVTSKRILQILTNMRHG